MAIHMRLMRIKIEKAKKKKTTKKVVNYLGSGNAKTRKPGNVKAVMPKPLKRGTVRIYK